MVQACWAGNSLWSIIATCLERLKGRAVLVSAGRGSRLDVAYGEQRSKGPVRCCRRAAGLPEERSGLPEGVRL